MYACIYIYIYICIYVYAFRRALLFARLARITAGSSPKSACAILCSPGES